MPEEEGRATRQDERARHYRKPCTNDQQHPRYTPDAHVVNACRHFYTPNGRFGNHLIFIAVTAAAAYLAAHVCAAAIGWQATAILQVVLLWALFVLRVIAAGRGRR